MYTLGSKPQWFNFGEVLKFSNNITSAVYAFAYCDKKPSDKIWPFAEEGLFYVGISGGKDDDFIFDKKNKDSHKGRFETSFHKRMKDHKCNLLGNGNKPETSYEVFREHFKGINIVGKELFVCVIVPDENINKEIMRTMLLMAEAEQKYLHYETFNRIPMMNIAERSSFSVKSKDKQSYSQIKVSNLKDNNLMGFFA